MALLDTPVCDFGWQAPDFTLKDPDGKEHSMSATTGKNGLLIAFICNHCPYVKAVIDRLAADAKVLQEEGFGVLAVMPNDYEQYPDDSPTEMQRFAQAHNFTFPYLVDEDQSVAKSYGAVCTPEFFGFNQNLELQYRGRIDDAKQGDASNRVPELLNAFHEIAKTGSGPKEQAASMGCSIKWR